ncbi:MAG: hypothetical protein AABY22_31635, partial [Nanoarchaeota archaeon]
QSVKSKRYKIRDTITNETMFCDESDIYKFVDLLNFWHDIKIAEIIQNSTEKRRRESNEAKK